MDWIAKYLPVLPSKREAAEARIGRDAGELIGIWGDLAYKVAADLSWREDIGLLHVAEPGHWMRVTLEIGRRMNIPTAPLLDKPVHRAAAGEIPHAGSRLRVAAHGG